MLNAMRTSIGKEKVVPNSNVVLVLQLLQLIATRTLGGGAKVIINCNALLE
jgi:hypothetical protein